MCGSPEPPPDWQPHESGVNPSAFRGRGGGKSTRSWWKTHWNLQLTVIFSRLLAVQICTSYKSKWHIVEEIMHQLIWRIFHFFKRVLYTFQMVSRISEPSTVHCKWPKINGFPCISFTLHGNYPIIYKVLYMPGGAGSLPSTVWLQWTSNQVHLRFMAIVNLPPPKETLPRNNGLIAGPIKGNQWLIRP